MRMWLLRMASRVGVNVADVPKQPAGADSGLGQAHETGHQGEDKQPRRNSDSPRLITQPKGSTRPGFSVTEP
jgi:hypothetical protein